MIKRNGKRIPLVLIFAFVALGSALESLEAQQSWSDEDSQQVIIRNTVKWISEHLVPYHFSQTYELSDGLVSHGHAPENAMALRCFDVPPSNAVYLYTSQYGRAHLYDTGLAIILLSLDGEYEKARNLLLALQHLQNSDGSIGFSWNTVNDNFYNRSYIRTGALAWAGYAAVIFQRESGWNTLQQFTEKIAHYILSLQVVDRSDKRYGLVKGGRGRWLPDGRTLIRDELQEWCATEHNIDAFFFLHELGQLTKNREYINAANLIRQGMLGVLWNDEKGRFNVAVDAKELNPDLALDSCSWGSMFLTALGEREKAQRCLDFVEEHFSSRANDITGYKAYAGNYMDHPVSDWTRLEMVWSEGSLGVAMAYLKLGNRQKCDEIVNQILKMRDEHCGIKYSIYSNDLPISNEAVKSVDGKPRTDKIEDFVRKPTASGTIWLGLVAFERIHPEQQKFWSSSAPDE